MERTGIFASEEEIAKLIQLVQLAQRTPVIAFSTEHALERGGCGGDAWHQARRICHKYALAHGLPEITGFYGADLQNREFVTQ